MTQVALVMEFWGVIQDSRESNLRGKLDLRGACRGYRQKAVVAGRGGTKTSDCVACGYQDRQSQMAWGGRD